MNHSLNNSKLLVLDRGCQCLFLWTKFIGIQPYTCVYVVSGFFHTTAAELSSCDTPYGMQSLKYFVFVSLQKILMASMV